MRTSTLLSCAERVDAKRIARAELESIATALESYRCQHGAYLESKSEATIIDHLNQRYLARDPRRSQGISLNMKAGLNTFVLRSAVPDGNPNTPDDVTVTH